MTEAVCVACRRFIDATARLCPYCGANPVTGDKVDTEAVLREVFHPREVTPAQTVIDFARHRQGTPQPQAAPRASVPSAPSKPR